MAEDRSIERERERRAAEALASQRPARSRSPAHDPYSRRGSPRRSRQPYQYAQNAATNEKHHSRSTSRERHDSDTARNRSGQNSVASSTISSHQQPPQKIDLPRSSDDFMLLLQDYGQKVAEKVSIQLRKDAAQFVLNLKISEAGASKNDDTGAKEPQREELEAARAEYERLDHELQARDDNLRGTITILANGLAVAVNNQYQQPETRKHDYQTELMANQYELKSSVTLLEKHDRKNFDNIRSLQQEINRLRQTIKDTSSETKTSDNTAQQAAMEKLTARVNEMPSQKLELNKSLQEIKKEWAQQRATFERNDRAASGALNKHFAAKFDALTSEIEAVKKAQGEHLLKATSSRTSDVENAKSSIQVTAKLASLTSAIEELKKTQSQPEVPSIPTSIQRNDLECMKNSIQETNRTLKALAKRVSTVEQTKGRDETSREQSCESSEITSELARLRSAQEKSTENSRERSYEMTVMRNELARLKAAQSAGDEEFGAIIDALSQQANKLETDFGAFRDSYALERSSMQSSVYNVAPHIPKLEAALDTLRIELQMLKTKPAASAVENRQSPMLQSFATNGETVPILAQQVDQKVSGIKDEITALYDDDIQTLKMGVRSLDARFSSLTTEHMARHILSQLQVFYPHAANMETALHELRESVSIQAGQINSAETRLEALNQQVTELTTRVNENEEPGPPLAVTSEITQLKTSLDSVRQMANDNTTAIEHNTTALETLQEQLNQTAEVCEALPDEIGGTLGHHLAMTDEAMDTVREDIQVLRARLGSRASSADRVRILPPPAAEAVNTPSPAKKRKLQSGSRSNGGSAPPLPKRRRPTSKVITDDDSDSNFNDAEIDDSSD